MPGTEGSLLFEEMTAAVIGAGMMGSSIGPLLAGTFGRVQIYDRIPKEEIEQRIAFHLGRMLKKTTIDEAEQTARATRIVAFQRNERHSLPQIKSADVVIEAIPEILKVKHELFEELDAFCPSHTIIFSNTSSLMLEKLHSVVSDERRANMAIEHFMNPAYEYPFIELVRSDYTSDRTFEFAKAMVHTFKTAVKGEMKKFEYSVWPDYPGYGANSQLFAGIAKALRLLEMGMPAEEVDKAFREGTNQRNGFLFTASWIGLDTCKHIMNNMYWQLKELGDPDYIFYRPSELLNKLVAAGKLGFKTKAKGEDPYAIWTSV